MKRIISFILLVIMLVSAGFYTEAKYSEDTSKNWKYVVPFGKYDYCQILSNGLIKVGKKIGTIYNESPMPSESVYFYGLLDKKGNKLTEIIYDVIVEMGYDGLVQAEIIDDGGKSKNNDFSGKIGYRFGYNGGAVPEEKIKRLIFDKYGKQIPISDDAKIICFDYYHYIEEKDSLSFYINGEYRKISKSVLNKADVNYDRYNVLGIFDKYLVMNDGRNAIVLNWDGKVVYKTEECIGVTPDGIILKNKNANESLVDFEGKVLIPEAWGRTIFPVRDYNNYIKYAENLYLYTGYTDKNERYNKLVNIKNPDIFKNKVDFDWIYYVDVDNKLICLTKETKGCALYSFDGKEILPFGKYNEIYKPSEGFIRFQKKDGKHGIANLKGEILFETKDYDLMWDCSEGLLPYYNKKDGIYGFFNKNFESVLKLDKGWVITEGFKYGLAIFDYKNEILFINREGKVMIAQGNEKWYGFYRHINGLIGVYQGEIYWGNGGNNTNRYLADGVIEYTGIPLGDVLYSDITAYINGQAIPTSVINGKTLVVVEDLANYGFDVNWNGQNRTLKAEFNKNKKFTPLKVEKDTKNKPGTFKCKYVYTDIKTYLSGKIVESYAINGVTLIDFELLGNYGKISWNGKTREINVVIDK